MRNDTTTGKKVFTIHHRSILIPWKDCESDITLVRDLLGHADLKTTEIYLSAVGREKRNIVLKAWD